MNGALITNNSRLSPSIEEQPGPPFNQITKGSLSVFGLKNNQKNIAPEPPEETGINPV
jgi:hypothetical protein